MFNPRKTRPRKLTLDMIKANLDDAKRALVAGDIEAHDAAMGQVTNFLAAYNSFPALAHVDAKAEEPATVEESADLGEPEAPATAESVTEVKPPKK